MLSVCVPLHAQVGSRAEEAPEPPPFRVGPLVVAPTLTLEDLGWDSNVLHLWEDPETAGDFTTTVTPDVRSWLRFGPARLRTHSTVDFMYFRDHASERSVDQTHEGRLEVRLGRLMPHVSGRWLRTRRRFGFEIDERTRRYERSLAAGADVRLGLRTTVEFSARRSSVEFDRTDSLSDPLVSDFYDGTSRGITLAVRHELTPVTSAALTVNKSRDRFDLDPSRDSESLGIGAAFEFEPTAVISGRAYLGWLRVNLIEPGSPPFGGVAASVNLTYTLLGSTLITVEANRDVSYSAIRGQHAYLFEGGRVLIRHRLNETWDIGGRVGRHELSYGLFGREVSLGDPVPGGLVGYHETVTEYAGEVGFRAGPQTRLGFTLGRQQRHSVAGPTRGYERVRAGLSITYRFR